jgi:hypothetical protein
MYAPAIDTALLAPHPVPAVLPNTLYAYLYQAENTIPQTDPTASMTLLSILFANAPSQIVAAGSLMTSGPQAVPVALAGTLNQVDRFGNRVDDLDLVSSYHPPHLANNGPPGVPGIPDPPEPNPMLDEEGPRPTDAACPGGDFTDPTEFCEASGVFGITTQITGGSVEFVLNQKPAQHETVTLYVLSPNPPIPGIARMQGVHQYSSEFTQRGLLGDLVPVPHAIPEPSIFLLFGIGLACLVGQALWRKLKA